jgi:hypothetical protein
MKEELRTWIELVLSQAGYIRYSRVRGIFSIVCSEAPINLEGHYQHIETGDIIHDNDIKIFLHLDSLGDFKHFEI